MTPKFEGELPDKQTYRFVRGNGEKENDIFYDDTQTKHHYEIAVENNLSNKTEFLGDPPIGDGGFLIELDSGEVIPTGWPTTCHIKGDREEARKKTTEIISSLSKSKKQNNS